MGYVGNQGGASLHVVAMRVVALTSTGTHNGQLMYATNNFMKMDFNPEIEAGVEVADKAADGSVYVSFKLQDIVKRLTTALEVMTNDPQLEALLTGGQVATSGGSALANVLGYQYPVLGQVSSPNGVGVELWTHNIVSGQIDSNQPYQRWIFPRVKLHKGNRTADINRMGNVYDGFAEENSNFGAGPAGDIIIPTTRVAQWQYDMAYPAPALGYSTASS